MRSVKPWLYIFSTDDPHSLVVNDTHSQVRTSTAVVRPSPRSHAKQPSSAKVAIILIHLLICIDTSTVWREDSQALIQVNGGEMVLLPSNLPTTYNKRKGFSPSEQWLTTCSVNWKHIH